jgi:hypothetical protein
VALENVKRLKQQHNSSTSNYNFKEQTKTSFDGTVFDDIGRVFGFKGFRTSTLARVSFSFDSQSPK